MTLAMPLVQHIAALRAQGETDVFTALLQAAPDAQALSDELGELLGLPVLRTESLLGMSPCFERLPFPECARRRCALLTDPVLDLPRLLVVDPFDTDTLAWACSRFGRTEPTLVSTVTFDAWLTHCEEQLTALDALPVAPASGDTPGPGSAVVLSLRQIGVDDSPSVRFVNSTLYDALKSGASDIHLETDPGGLTVKFRLDGVLTVVSRIDGGELLFQAISRIKVMALLDIAERRVPQDGRLQIALEGRMVDVRVSIMPSIHGEDAVLRLLDRQHLAQTLAGLTLDKLGFEKSSADAIRALCRKPHGMMLVTGPTGSGKTTTLYAVIAETHHTRDKIITIEDPVEYQLSGVTQISVNERKGLTFARGLRSILRHDPDKILVGEIRDAETAEIAMQSALTGHLVFTTVHANTVFDVVGRFQQLGIDAYTFASAVNGVLAQRLLRRLCVHCREPLPPDEVQAWRVRANVALEGVPRLARAVGCEHCRGTGYAGRFALGELLPLTPELKALISTRAPYAQLQAEAERSGWRSLRSLALQTAWDGHTSLEEVDRVAD